DPDAMATPPDGGANRRPGGTATPEAYAPVAPPTEARPAPRAWPLRPGEMARDSSAALAESRGHRSNCARGLSTLPSPSRLSRAAPTGCPATPPHLAGVLNGETGNTLYRVHKPGVAPREYAALRRVCASG